ncbi:hypothetical protein [Nocardia camponoti]|uniref:Uncharacterized protein n=1 Tax=Nocardia camponoti TaxID=1616106 RepID=A0A917QIP0_9NOCA|nr:hypothetical protein [Nocardia camponoti]GGK50806.1 hypothetical protein GCM10011591_22960 [Nocardia camponoti]
MTEALRAVPGEIAGLGNLVSEIGTDINSAAFFIGEHGKPAEWLSGPIIDDLLEPFSGVAAATKTRMSYLSNTTQGTGTELNKAAWMYHDKDQQNYAALNSHTMGLDTVKSPDVETQGVTSFYDSAVKYNKAKEFKLDEPQANKEDTAGLIAEVAPVLGDVNESIKSITRTAGQERDLLGECLKPIPGNWNEIRRIGECHKAAGNGMEACGDNLEAGLRRVDASWDGLAAQAFTTWANRAVAAMKWEGPVGRIVSDAFAVIADEIRAAVKAILTKIWDVLKSRINFTSIKGIFQTIARKIPVVGQIGEIIELGYKFANIIADAIGLVGKIRELVDKVKKLLEYLNDPVGKLKQNAEQKLAETVAPITNRVNDVTRKAAIAQDLARISQVNDTLNSPDAAFEVGTGHAPWSNA